MAESLISLGLIAFLCIIAWAISANAEMLIWGGIGLAAIGFAYGIPAAVVYHWRLRQSLKRCDRLPKRWWLQPTSLHGLIPADDRMGVFVWGAIGGSGFVLIIVAIILTSIGLWRMLAS